MESLFIGILFVLVILSRCLSFKSERFDELPRDEDTEDKDQIYIENKWWR